MDASHRGPLGQSLLLFRRRAGWSQERLASESGIAVRTISDLERGRVSRPHGNTIALLAAALGLTRPERETLLALEPVAVDDRADDGPRARGALGIVPRQLPADLRDFVGRAREVELALDYAQQTAAAPSVLCLVGMGGIGKTSLAVHIGTRLAPLFPGGQFFVNMRGFDADPLTAGQALTHMMRSLGVDGRDMPTGLVDQTNRYRSLLTNRRMLILLDNVIDERQVREILPGSPGCLALITGRNVLAGLDNSRTIVLPTLVEEESIELLTSIVAPNRSTPVDLNGTRDIVDVCGGLPLALRLAGARLATRPNWTMAEFAATLRDEQTRIAGLAVGDRSVAATFDLSYRALAPEDQRLLCCVAQLPSPEFPLPAAIAVTMRGNVRAGLERLVDLSLLDSTSAGRYRLHDLLRVYASQHAIDHHLDIRAAVSRGLDWYLRTADAAVTLTAPTSVRLPPPHRPITDTAADELHFFEVDEALAWLDLERQNIIDGIRHAIHHNVPEYAWRLADTMRADFHRLRQLPDWITVSHAALSAAETAADAPGQAAIHLSLGLAHKCSGDYDMAAYHYRNALVASEQADWPDGEAAATGNLGIVAYYTGHLEEARTHYLRASRLSAARGNIANQAVALINLGEVEYLLDRLDSAANSYAEAERIYQGLNDRDSRAFALSHLAQIGRRRGETLTAVLQAELALRTARHTGAWLGSILIVYGHCLLDLGRTDDTDAVIQEVTAVARRTGDREIEVDATNLSSALELRVGNTGTAMAGFQRALAMAQRSGLIHAQLDALLGIAEVNQAMEEERDVRRACRQALKIARNTGNRLYERLAQTAADKAAGQVQPTDGH